MNRSEAWKILGELQNDVTEVQREALNIAQKDIQFRDLIPLVFCRECKWRYTSRCVYERDYSASREDCDFCSEGERI